MCLGPLSKIKCPTSPVSWLLVHCFHDTLPLLPSAAAGGQHGPQPEVVNRFDAYSDPNYSISTLAKGTAIQSWHWPPRGSTSPISYRTWFPIQLSFLQTPTMLWVSPGHLHFWQTGYNFSGSHNPVRFINSLEQLIGRRKALYLCLQFHYEGYKSGGPDR